MKSIVRLADVARHAGVSIPTVSRILNGVQTVAPELRERVMKSVEELGYQPNRMAKSLREQRTGILAHLTAGLNANFHATLARGVQDAAFDLGYTMILGSSHHLENGQSQLTYAKLFDSYRVDGMVVVPSSTPDPYLETLSSRIPIIEVDRTVGEYSRHAVLLNNAEVMGEAVRHLISLGHRNIALLYGIELVSTEVERYQGFMRAMKEGGVPVDPRFLISDDFTEEGGHRAFQRLVGSGLPVTAVVVTTNEMLAGVVGAARQLGVRIPEDISLIGMDDERWVRMMSPALTVMAQTPYEMGYEACRLLIQCVEGQPGNTPWLHRIPGQLVVRESTAPPRLSG
ncbi:LacI family DNA-binding transcriptional regulator [Deinococcus cellulosilyticus]|uniref:LacI family transcriptional regulator n=1 Tax=Deinococcus cellulosilyticus (strain DSM 18568 / NBRC 106333 / KACC 11606 / 5516J-15) TaxID=1223518 RepID=A0A511MYB0_DEIC1|nr:LacI family DNA-binding transcriptional regulator [Deinococcus cellulosilyticus]GEM45549.1 LacI family transcriptional regulator [Deinococcus cellulosilyticus NBRC 106333 = KACC 11606]